MQKTNVKTESVAEFMARGGTIKRVITKAYKRPTAKQLGYQKEVEVTVEDANLDALPETLKIRFGIR